MIVFDRKEKEIKVPEGLGNINLTVVDANLEDKTVEINEVKTTILPSSGYNGMSSLQIDAQPVYDNGYNQGSTDGYDTGYVDGEYRGFNNGYTAGETDQKAKLTGITITENGTYTRENGYNEVVVEVPDLNGDYNEGYDAGLASGYDSGYTAGIDYASENAGEIAAANAVDLVATEFGTYYTKYSDNIQYPQVTGVYPNGENFYNYSIINDECYSTLIKINNTSKVEIWWNNINSLTNGDKYIFGTEYQSLAFNLNYDLIRKKYVAKISFSDNLYFSFDYDGWHHIIMSFENGLIVDGKQIGNFNSNLDIFSQVHLFLNGLNVNKRGNANGYFGMIKITTDGVETVIIPTANGFLNTTSNQILDDVDNGGTYEYIDNTPIILDNLIKTVNVQPKIDVAKYGLKFANSTFSEMPDFFDFEGITNVKSMFRDCDSLQTIPLIDTSKVTNMNYMFGNCGSLQTIPELDTSNVTNMNNMFFNCGSLQTIPELDTSNVTNMGYMFQMYNSNSNLISLPKIYCDSCTNIGNYFQGTRNYLTDVGGWINLKTNWNDNYGLASCPNLNYQSCINILNGLYDFVGNGETPTSSQGKLKVHSNFLTTVGDEISIAIAKGWQISA